MMKTAKLLLHCPDKPGILAEVTDFITVNKGNIIYLDQYVDHVENIFFMRIEWELKNFLIPQEKIEECRDSSYYKQPSRLATCCRTFRNTFLFVPYYKGDKRRTGEKRNGIAGKT